VAKASTPVRRAPKSPVPAEGAAPSPSSCLPATSTVGSGTHLHLERIALPGRPEALLVIRGFAAHVPPRLALNTIKTMYWGRDPDDDDVRWLTQWEYVDWSALRRLLDLDLFVDHVCESVSSAGFGQLRWYGATHQTSRHSDGFDGTCTTSGSPVLGCARYLLRLGGDGFLTLWWEPAGGPTGKVSTILSHGDLAIMDHGISGTHPSGRQRQRRLRVTHRAGGLAAPDAPREFCYEQAQSFATLVWTNCIARDDFMAFYEEALKPLLASKPVCLGDSTQDWPGDPDDVASEVNHTPLLPWEPGLSLADRQAPLRDRCHAKRLTMRRWHCRKGPKSRVAAQHSRSRSRQPRERADSVL